MQKIGICKLCLKNSHLQISHAIGDSIFKKIFRKYSGKAIEITTDDKHISYSSDSWAEPQLCEDCEQLLNSKYEDYALSVLRAQKKVKITKTEMGITFSNIDLHIMNMYFFSIFWRAANSGHEKYKNLSIPDDDNEYLRKAIYEDNGIAADRFLVKLSRLIDRTKVGGFSKENLKEIIAGPFQRNYFYKGVQHSPICFVFEGFLVEFFEKGLELKDRDMVGIVDESKDILFVSYLNIFCVLELLEVILAGYQKQKSGLSRIKK